MTLSSQTELGLLPQLWKADVDALQKSDIVTTEDLVRTVHKDGLTSLSKRSGIQSDQLQQYFAAAEAINSRQRIRRFAAGIFVSVGFVIVVSCVWMISGGLLTPAGAAYDAYAAYAEAYQMYLDPEVAKDDLRIDVNNKLDSLKKAPEVSLVNLRLLKSALYDDLAIEELQAAGDNPTSEDFDARYKEYKTLFKEARAEQDRVQQGNDPRIAFARVNAAQAWSSRADKLAAIDSKHFESEIEKAKNEASTETEQVLKTTGRSEVLLGLIKPEVFAERIDDIPYQPPSPEQQRFEELHGELVETLQRSFGELSKQMKGQESSIVRIVDDAHDDTRDLIASGSTSLAVAFHSIDEKHVVDIGATGPSATCGLRGMDTAKSTIITECFPRDGLNESVGFELRIEDTPGDGVPSIVVENGQAPNTLACAIEEVMAKFAYDDGVHHCRLVLSTERSNVYQFASDPNVN